MKRNLLILTLIAAAVCAGCASQPVVQRHGSLQAVARHGTTYHLDAGRSGLGEDALRGLRDRLGKAGLTPASADSAQLIVTLTNEHRSVTERRHTGGKNGVSYDHKADDHRLTLTVIESRPGAGSALMERRHTGGKNGVAYDHRVDRRGLLLEISSTGSGAATAASLLDAALAGLGG